MYIYYNIQFCGADHFVTGKKLKKLNNLKKKNLLESV